MPDVIDAVMEKNELGHVLLDEFKVLVHAKVIDVLDRAGHEIVDADDAMSARDEQIRQVRSEESRCAGHQFAAGGVASAPELVANEKVAKLRET